MILNKDTYNITFTNSLYAVSICSAIGDRHEQQDIAGYKIEDDSLIVTICDGMGGHKQGKEASMLATDTFYESLENVTKTVCNKRITLINAINMANDVVHNIKDEFGHRSNAGTTMIGTILQGHEFTWMSIGDSRICFIRDGEIVQITKDQIFANILQSRYASGKISKEEYESMLKDKDKLINYVGIGDSINLSENSGTMKLISGDKIILMTDGLYKLLDYKSIVEILSNFSNLSDALEAIEYKVRNEARINNKKRDNMTVAIINIR